MGIRYNPLWKLLVDKKLTRAELSKMTGIAVSTFTRMGNEEYASLETLERICEVLDCQISDIVEYYKKEE